MTRHLHFALIAAAVALACAPIASAQQRAPQAVSQAGQTVNAAPGALIVAPAGGVLGKGRPVAEDAGLPIYGRNTTTHARCVVGVDDNCTSAPGSGGGGGTASLAPWLPDYGSLQALVPTGTASTSATFAGGTGSTVYVKNVGLVPFHVRTGIAGVTATLTDEHLQPGMCGPFNRVNGVTTYDRVSIITDSGTGAAELTTGTGNPGFGICATNLTASAPVVGSLAHGVAATDPPVVEGCRASTTAPTAEADGTIVYARCSPAGARTIEMFTAPALKFRFTPVTLTTTTETPIIPAVAGFKNNLTQIKLCNNSATQVRVDIRDVAAGTVQDTWTVAPGVCVGGVLNTPMVQTTANTAWTAQLSANVTDVRITGQYVQ